MKKHLLLFLLAVTTGSFAQHSINGFYGYINDVLWTSDGTGSRYYDIVTSAVPLDESATGANIIWNFNQLTSEGFSTYHNALPTALESSTYPGTNRVVTNTRAIGETQTISKVYFNDWATAGVSNSDFQINYTDNGILTNASLDYGNTYADPISGSFTYDIYSGTFTGTMVTTVDAYGSLTTNVFGPYTYEVTRMKVVQSLTLSSPPFGEVGTAVFTNYYYYRLGDLYPFFNSATSDFNIPLLAIDEEITTYEMANPAFLGTTEISQNKISIAPVPVRDVLTIRADAAISWGPASIMDINGRIVMNGNLANSEIDLSQLTRGIYFLRIDSDRGTITKKIVKE